MDSSQTNANPLPFKAETRQLLNILIHSLYKDREVFLRELISNASDALTRLNFEMLQNRDIVDADAETAIWVSTDAQDKLLIIRDTGLGMTAEEMAENLGTIAHSGARAFLDAAEKDQTHIADIIGQFGVGFYSAFMVADWIKVTSRSFKPEAAAATWYSTGSDTFQIEPAEKADRGTVVTIKLKEDAAEFAEEWRLREIIKRHSDYIPYPIYLGEKAEQVNRQTTIWRQQPRQVKPEDYTEFYKQFTLEFDAPLTYSHVNVDAPVQMYAILYVPGASERGIFSSRREDGLKLYARKVLIQEFCKDLLPNHFRFIQGVVDSEDLPLNVSRETIQSNRVMAQLKKLITNKVTDMLKTLAKDKPEDYIRFWEAFGPFIKEGIATDAESLEPLQPLLRFHTLSTPDQWISLETYVAQLKPEQKKIYYILGDDERSIVRSPHLDRFRHLGYDVLLLTDPLDSFMLLALKKYQEYDLVNVSSEKLDLPAAETEGENAEKALDDFSANSLVERFKAQLGERVADVRLSDQLIDSPARLVDAEGSPNQEMQRVYRMLKREFPAPQKVLEINPRHAILKQLSNPETSVSLSTEIIEQLYENALLIEGLHPDPASMIERIQKLMQAALH